MSEIMKNTSVVPDGWSIVSLGDVLQYEQPYYYTVTSDDYNDIAGTPVLTAGKSFLLGYTTEVENVYNNLPVIIFNDFTTDSKFVDFPFKVKSSAMKFLKPKEENVIDLRLIFEFIQKLKISVANADHKRRWISEFSKIKILIPSYPEQQHIAKILSTADSVIEKTQAAIAKYKAIKQGMLQDLFTRGIDLNTNKLRPRYEDAPELYKESKLGWIPREWEVERIDTQAKITTGSKDTQNKIEHGVYPFFVRSQTVEKIDSYTYDGEAILTSGDGVGVGKIYHYINGKFDFHQRVYMLYEFEKTISPKFLFYYFSNNFLAVVEKYSAKNTVDSVRMEMIAGMIIPLPPINEQKQISERLNAIDNKLQTEQTYLQKMQSLKKGLMEDLLSGRKCLNLDFQDEQINQDSKTILQSVNLVNQDADNYPVNPKIE